MRLRSVLLTLILLLVPACGAFGGGRVDGPLAPTTTPRPAAVAPTTAETTPTDPTAEPPKADPTNAIGEATAEATMATEPTIAPTMEATAEQPTEPATEPTEEPTAPAEPTPPPPTATPPAGPWTPEGVNLVVEPAYEGFELPVSVVAANDGSNRLFIVEKTGDIRVIADGTLLPDPLLDITGLISDGSEQGLLGMAFEPGRSERFYVNYTNLEGDTIIARYRVRPDNPNIADPNSAETLIRIDDPAANHNGGDLQFGPDGYLWIGMGDGGGADDIYQNAQNPNTILGDMLRIDVRGETGYAIPDTNPFADGVGGAQAVYYTGLRNPWRYSFDRVTGDLWIADVGQNGYEEINKVDPAQAELNFGWPIMEASRCFASADCSSDGLVMPVAEYDHSEGCSVTGGYVYRGAAYPALYGAYLYSDYCSGRIWAISADVNTLTPATVLLDSGLSVVAFGEDEAGELYLAAFDGIIYRVTAP